MAGSTGLRLPGQDAERNRVRARNADAPGFKKDVFMVARTSESRR